MVGLHNKMGSASGLKLRLLSFEDENVKAMPFKKKGGGAQGAAKSRPPSPETDHNSLSRGGRGTVLQATPGQQDKPYTQENPWRVKRAHHDLTRSRSPRAKAPLTLTTRTSAPEPSSWPAFGG